MLAEYMQQERRGSALERTLNKREQNDLMNCGGLNRFMAGQPRTYSQFLYNSSLVAHMLTVFKTSIMNIKTTNNNGPYINQSFHANIIKQFNHSTKLQMASLVQRVTTAILLRGASTGSTSAVSHLAQSQKQPQQSQSAF